MCKINCSGGCEECSPEDHYISAFLENYLHNKLPFDTPEEFMYKLEEAILVLKKLGL